MEGEGYVRGGGFSQNGVDVAGVWEKKEKNVRAPKDVPLIGKVSDHMFFSEGAALGSRETRTGATVQPTSAPTETPPLTGTYAELAEEGWDWTELTVELSHSCDDAHVPSLSKMLPYCMREGEFMGGVANALVPTQRLPHARLVLHSKGLVKGNVSRDGSLRT